MILYPLPPKDADLLVPKAKNKEGNTALHLAAMLGHARDSA